MRLRADRAGGLRAGQLTTEAAGPASYGSNRPRLRLRALGTDRDDLAGHELLLRRRPGDPALARLGRRAARLRAEA